MRSCWLDSLWHLVAHMALGAAAVVIIGCQAPAPILQADAAADRSVATYARNMDLVARRAAEAYRAEARAHVAELYRAGLDAHTDPATGAVPREQIERAEKARETAWAKIDAEYQAVMTALVRARLDLEDAQALRAEVRAYLEAAGVGPEAIQAVGFVLSERLSRGE